MGQASRWVPISPSKTFWAEDFRRARRRDSWNAWRGGRQPVGADDQELRQPPTRAQADPPAVPTDPPGAVDELLELARAPLTAAADSAADMCAP
jgi:hypothetical protein